MTDDDYDALSQKQLASIKRDMRISLEDAAVRATYKVMAELAQPDQDEVDIRSRLYQRIHELETQLAQPEQEPVVWTEKVGGIGFKDPMLNASYKVTATIAPQRTWVGLTDEEIKQGESKGELGHGFIQGALWAEAKLKEKNA
jgi:hypothetical protein